MDLKGKRTPIRKENYKKRKHNGWTNLLFTILGGKRRKTEQKRSIYRLYLKYRKHLFINEPVQ